MAGIGLDELTDIQIIDSGGDELAIAADGSIAVTDNGGSLTVDAVDLDIRDLINTQDSVAVGDETDIVDMATMDSAFGLTSVGFPIMGIRQDGAGSPVSATGDAHPLVFDDAGQLKVATSLTSDVADDDPSTENPIAVGSRGVSGLLTALSASNDKADLLSDLYRRLWVNNSANVAIKTTAETVGTSAAQIVSSPLAGRKTVTLQNEGSVDVFFGPTGVTTATGMKISKKSSATYEFAEDIDIFMISGSAGQDVRVLEAG